MFLKKEKEDVRRARAREREREREKERERQRTIRGIDCSRLKKRCDCIFFSLFPKHCALLPTRCYAESKQDNSIRTCAALAAAASLRNSAVRSVEAALMPPTTTDGDATPTPPKAPPVPPNCAIWMNEEGRERHAE